MFGLAYHVTLAYTVSVLRAWCSTARLNRVLSFVCFLESCTDRVANQHAIVDLEV